MKKETREVLALAGAEAAVIGIAALFGRVKAKPPVPPGMARITGRVTDQQTNFNIPFATLTIDTIPVSVDEKGNFIIDKVPLGKYTVKASAPGYRPASFEWDITEAKSYLQEIELVPVETLW